MQAIPTKMKAAILTELNKPLTVAEIELPKSLAVGQVLVKIHSSGILGIWEQLHNPDFKGVEFDTFKKEAGLNSFRLTPNSNVYRTLL